MAAFKPAQHLTQAQYDALEDAGCVDESLDILNGTIDNYNETALRQHKVAELLTINNCADIDEFMLRCAEQKVKLKTGKK